MTLVALVRSRSKKTGQPPAAVVVGVVGEILAPGSPFRTLLDTVMPSREKREATSEAAIVAGEHPSSSKGREEADDYYIDEDLIGTTSDEGGSTGDGGDCGYDEDYGGEAHDAGISSHEEGDLEDGEGGYRGSSSSQGGECRLDEFDADYATEQEKVRLLANVDEIELTPADEAVSGMAHEVMMEASPQAKAMKWLPLDQDVAEAAATADARASLAAPHLPSASPGTSTPEKAPLREAPRFAATAAAAAAAPDCPGEHLERGKQQQAGEVRAREEGDESDEPRSDLENDNVSGDGAGGSRDGGGCVAHGGGGSGGVGCVSDYEVADDISAMTGATGGGATIGTSTNGGGSHRGESPAPLAVVGGSEGASQAGGGAGVGASVASEASSADNRLVVAGQELRAAGGAPRGQEVPGAGGGLGSDEDLGTAGDSISGSASGASGRPASGVLPQATPAGRRRVSFSNADGSSTDGPGALPAGVTLGPSSSPPPT